MANELTISAPAVSYEDTFGVLASIDIPALSITLSTKKVVQTKQTVGTSEEPLIIGDVVSLGYCVIINRDDTNFVNVKVGTGGAIFSKLLPGRWLIVPLGSGAQAPYVIADTATCDIEIFLCAV